MRSTDRQDFRLRAALFAFSALAAGACGGAARAQSDAEPQATLSEITVTAQKRTQNLQDVPISITAIDQGALQSNRITNVTDLNALAPNLTVRVSAGGSGVPSFTVRGLVSYGSLPGTDKSVSVYVDGVYLGYARGSIFDFPEIDRIEVLRGPQGTLFGRNATAGAISVVTRDPPGKFGLRQELTWGNYDQKRSKTRLDLPAWGPLSASITYVHDERNGDIRNLGAGQVWDRTGITDQPALQVSPKHLGNKNNEAVFAAVKFAPSANFSIKYKYDYTEGDASPEGVAVIGVNPPALGASGATLAAIIASQPTPVAFNTSARRPDALNNSWVTPSHLKTYGHSLTAQLAVNDRLSFQDILAYRRVTQYSYYQLDGLGGLVNTIAALGPLGAPYVVTAQSNETVGRQWSNEFQVNYNSKLLTLTAGALYFDLYTFQGPPAGFTTSTSLRVVPDGRIAPVFPAVGRAYNWATSSAAYVQAEAHLTSRIDLVGGYRITRDKKTGDLYNPGVTSFTYEKTKPSYMAGVNFKPVDAVLLYAKYSNAFVSGGAIGPFAFLPETAHSWEGGVKADLLARRLRVNLALFDVKYNHIQSAQSGRNVGFPALSTVVIDQGGGKAKGFEAEATVLPMRGLTLGATLGYTDFKYTSMSPILGTLQTYLPTLRSKWTSTLSAQYESEPVIGEARLRLRADANYRSKQRLDSAATPFAPAFAPIQSTPASWIINGRVALERIRIPAGEAEVALWVRNLTNNKAPAFATVLGNYVATASFTPARTYGIDLALDF
jgi:iron complex outermembrane receptor protein